MTKNNSRLRQQCSKLYNIVVGVLSLAPCYVRKKQVRAVDQTAYPLQTSVASLATDWWMEPWPPALNFNLELERERTKEEKEREEVLHLFRCYTHTHIFIYMYIHIVIKLSGHSDAVLNSLTLDHASHTLWVSCVKWLCHALPSFIPFWRLAHPALAWHFWYIIYIYI